VDFTNGEIKNELILIESGDYQVVKPEWNKLKLGNETFSLEKR
jgi:hypothetical protein